MGSYLAVLRRPGFAEVRYPFVIGRAAQVRAHVVLLTPDEVGGEHRFAYVPEMTVFLGPDPIAGSDGRTVHTQGFSLARYHVTMEDYVGFINDVAGSDPYQALARSPRRAPDGGHYWTAGPDGLYSIPEGLDAEGDRHDPLMPVVGISWQDARAYCAWRSAKEGREYRLPTQDEWEIAARGADSRVYPWGNVLEESYCHCRGVRHPLPVTEFPTDISPLGVYGMAGNAEEFCNDVIDADASIIATRGGSWFPSGTGLRSATRHAGRDRETLPTTGFRLLFVPLRIAWR